MRETLSSFTVEGQQSSIVFITSVNVTTGVRCDVYEILGDPTKDVGKIYIDPNCRTPLQKVLNGDRTIEGHISGQGSLTIIKPDGEKDVYSVAEQGCGFSQEVKVGELMQWRADLDSELVVCEICYPPYQDGRYENIPENRV